MQKNVKFTPTATSDPDICRNSKNRIYKTLSPI